MRHVLPLVKPPLIDRLTLGHENGLGTAMIEYGTTDALLTELRLVLRLCCITDTGNDQQRADLDCG